MIDVKSLIELANAAKARAEKAPPGPWELDIACDPVWIMDGGEMPWWASGVNTSDGNPYRPHVFSFDSCKFVAAARSDVPALADAVIGLAAELEAVSETELIKLRAALEEVQAAWPADTTIYVYGPRKAVRWMKDRGYEQFQGDSLSALVLAGDERLGYPTVADAVKAGMERQSK